MKIWYKAHLIVLVSALFLQSCTALKPAAFGPGDTIGVMDGMSITLEKAQVNESKLVADFKIDNSHGTKDQDISAAVNFSANDAKDNPLKFALCDNSSINGTVLAGDQLKGQICWEIIKEDAPVKIYFLSKSGDPSSVIWEAK